MTVVHTISDPSAPSIGVNSPRLHKRPSSKDNKRKRPHLIEKYGMKCFWCGTSLTPETITIDHYIPLSRGGSNKIKNLRLACRRCNQNRGNALPREAEGQRSKGGKNFSLCSPCSPTSSGEESYVP